MIDLHTFSAGLALIGLQLNMPASAQIMKAYHDALCDETRDVEWTLFCRTAVKRFAWRFLPSVPQLLDALREFRGAPPLDVEAQEAYDRVCSASTYLPEGGDVWIYRDVLARCGRAAADAFQAAGGGSAWGRGWDAGKRQAAFLEAYKATARAEPTLRLLPPGDAPRALPPPPDERIDQARAVEVVEKLREICAAPKADPPKVTRVELTDERLAELQRQREQLLAEQPQETA